MLVKWEVFVRGDVREDNSPRTNTPPFIPLADYFIA